MSPARIAFASLMGVALALLPQDARSAPKVVGAVVAVVNGEPITVWQVRKRIEPMLQSSRASSKSWQWPEIARGMLRDALEREIEDRLFSAAAQARGIVVDRTRIDVQLRRLASESKRSVESYLVDLAAAGWSETLLREELGRQILEWDVLHQAWSDSHDAPVPAGDGWLEWRKSWLAERRAAACIELRMPDGP